MIKNSETKISEFPSFLYDQGDRISLLKEILKVLGNPDKQFKIIHVCGTNGKGSTATMIASILRGLGERVGLFTSPYIGTILNGIQVDFKDISQDEFDAQLTLIEQALTRQPFRNNQVSEFEAQFLAAMLYFANQKVTYVVLECGLGGELDATNAVFTTMYSIFTKIGLDHVGILGRNLTEIATTKSKIIRPHNTTIVAPNQPTPAFNVLQSEAHLKQATFLTTKHVRLNANRNKNVIQINYELPNLNKSGHFNFNLVGIYQLENLATVLTWFFDFITKVTNQKSPDQILNQALSTLTIPGRFETVQQKPQIILDGAHNPDGIQAFTKTVNQLYSETPKIIVNGFLKDKSYEAAVKHLISLKNTSFIITEPVNQKRELSPDKLSNVYFRLTGKHYPNFLSPIDALNAAIERADSNTIIFIVGSFYLLNPIRTYLLTRSEPVEN